MVLVVPIPEMLISRGTIRPPPWLYTTPDRNKRSAVDFRAAKLETSRGKILFYRGEQGYGPAAAGEPRLWRGARHGPLATTLQDRQAHRKSASPQVGKARAGQDSAGRDRTTQGWARAGQGSAGRDRTAQGWHAPGPPPPRRTAKGHAHPPPPAPWPPPLRS